MVHVTAVLDKYRTRKMGNGTLCFVLFAVAYPIDAKVRTRPLINSYGVSGTGRFRDAGLPRRKLDRVDNDNNRDDVEKAGKGKKSNIILPSTQPSTLMPSSAPSQSSWPSTSSNPSSLPTVSSFPSLSVEPSNIPSLSVEPSNIPSLNPSYMPTNLPSFTPTTTPSTDPTLIPSVDPSAKPTGLPSHSPTGIPSVDRSPVPSTSPTESQRTPSGTPNNYVETEAGDVVEFSCQTAVAPDGFTQEQFQLIETQAEICVQHNSPLDLGLLPSDILTYSIIPQLVQQNIDCDFDMNVVFSGFVQDAGRAGALVDGLDRGDGRTCYKWSFGFQANYFEKQTVRDLDVVQQISNMEVARRLYNSLVFIFEGIPFAKFEGFLNLKGATPGIPGVPDDQPNSTLGNAWSSSSESSIVIPVIVVVCAVLLFSVVIPIALRRRQESEKKRVISHVLLKEEDDEEVEGTEGSIEKSSVSTGVILRDLDHEEPFDDEVGTVEDSIQVSHPLYPQLYVVRDGDNETTIDDAEESRFTLGGIWTSGQSAGQRPTFVTTDLKKAMKDLEPAPPTPKHPRGYVQEDTIEL